MPEPVRIMVVDDTEANRYAVSRHLRQAGYTVWEAADGRSALTQMADRVPDLLIVDVRMPGLDGFEVVRRLRSDARTAHVPVLHVSASFTDPMSQAVNDLSRETGRLFVIAAGNSGPASGTVGAPGAADEALTVAAVDKQDAMASFSSRGPRVGDGAAKPDIAAPGVNIVAARAAGTAMGTVVDQYYTTASGTSMEAFDR